MALREGQVLPEASAPVRGAPGMHNMVYTLNREGSKKYVPVAHIMTVIHLLRREMALSSCNLELQIASLVSMWRSTRDISKQAFCIINGGVDMEDQPTTPNST